MPRIYLPLEVDFDDDDKVARLARYSRPGEARACRDLLVSMWRYCKRNTTDGHVPLEQLGKLVYPDTPKVGLRDADRLVEIGMAERTEDGYYLPGYLKRNKSRAQLADEAAVKAEAGRKGGKRSGEVRRREAEPEAPDEAERSSVLPTSEAIDRDRDKNSTTAVGSRTAPPGAVAQAVKAYVEACPEHPAESLQDHVARSARTLLGEGVDPALITAAARNAGRAGYTDLARQIQLDATRASPEHGRPATNDLRVVAVAEAVTAVRTELAQLEPPERRAIR